MKKTMMLLLCLLIVVSLFATTALAAAIPLEAAKVQHGQTKQFARHLLLSQRERNPTLEKQMSTSLKLTTHIIQQAWRSESMIRRTEKKRLRGRPITTGQALQPISIQISLIIPGEQSAVTLIYSI